MITSANVVNACGEQNVRAAHHDTVRPCRQISAGFGLDQLINRPGPNDRP